MQPCHGASVLRYVAGMMIFLALSGCYDEEDPTLPSTEPVEAATGDNPNWLGVGDGRAPDAFLAEISGLPATDLAPQLENLSAQYRESPRMIANRVLQLWQEYPEIALPTMMSDLVPLQGDPDRSLGAVVQQYRVLRQGGVDHAKAIAAVLGNAG